MSEVRRDNDAVSVSTSGLAVLRFVVRVQGHTPNIDRDKTTKAVNRIREIRALALARVPPRQSSRSVKLVRDLHMDRVKSCESATDREETASMVSHAPPEPVATHSHIAYELNDDKHASFVIVEFLSCAIADPAHAAELSQQLCTLIRPELPNRFVLDFDKVRSLSSTAFGDSSHSSSSAPGRGKSRDLQHGRVRPLRRGCHTTR